jgi:hypothetical protein
MKIKYTLIISLFSIFFTNTSTAQSPNWSDDVAEIIYKNCSNCHHTGGIAPFELMSYQNAVKNSGMIKINVSNHSMPPWPPDPTYRRYAHERLLTQTEISTIVDWVDAATPRGNIANEPNPPVYTTSGLISVPDLDIRIPIYTSTAATSDDYRCFVIPSGVTSNKFISEIEVIPGNGAIVHHVLMYSDIGTTCSNLDAADPLPGYTNFGGTGDYNSKLIGGWVPGQGKMQLPAGFGLKLPANCNIILQIHYPAGSDGQLDSTRVRLKFTSSANPREVSIDAPLDNFTSSLIGGPLSIPPNTVKTYKEKYVIPTNVTVFSAQPHMHLIGKKIICYGVTPANDTIPVIRINDWDFHWQGQYEFQHALKVPAGTTLYAIATYDNTSANPHNPSSPPVHVYAGEKTTDEMMMVFFSYTSYKTGDENILLDSSLLISRVPNMIRENEGINLFPNPTVSKLHISGLNENLPYEAEIYDLSGRLKLKTQNSENLDVSSLQVCISSELSRTKIFLTENLSGNNPAYYHLLLPT